MPDVTQTDVGRRMYHLHREKRVEHAIKKIQHGVGPGWRSFTQDDIILLGHLLQCTWNDIDQKIWDEIPFARMTKEKVQEILTYGEGVRPRNNPEPAAVEEIKKILMALV